MNKSSPYTDRPTGRLLSRRAFVTSAAAVGGGAALAACSANLLTRSGSAAAPPTAGDRTGQVFGVHLNSVVFAPATAGYYGQNMSDWNENALARQLDSHGAHTRPDGFYHLHVITDAWESDPTQHSALVAWAADGFPVY